MYKGKSFERYTKGKNIVVKIVFMYVFVFSMFFLLSACSELKEEKKEIVVFAAASLTESFGEIKEEYERDHENVEIIYNFAGSQVLKNQILEGANPTMFFSANYKYPKELIENGVENKKELTEEDIVEFAKNKLVLIGEKDSDCAEFGQMMKEIEGSNISIVIAHDQVPVGKYTKSMIETYKDLTGNSKETEAFYNHVVSYENDVKAVLTKVKLNEVDLGVVYGTDASCEIDSIKIIEIPVDYNQVAVYGSLYLDNHDYTREFYNYVIKGQGQDILDKYGFVTKK